MTILKQAVAAVLDRRNEYEIAENYYQGDIPETFTTSKLRKAMRNAQDDSRLNFCRPVVDAVNDRLEIASITGDTKAATAKINEVWKNNELDLEAQEIHRKALTYGDAFAIVWPDSNGDLQVAYNSPETTAIVYDAENPRKKAYAVKMWKSDENTTRLNIYTAETITRYTASGAEVTEGTNWTQVSTDDNPFGEIPVFHFRTHRPFGRPEHKDAYSAQNAINKLFITNMFTIDYHGAPQRFALASMDDTELKDFDEGGSDRENAESLKAGPGELWMLRGITNVGEFKPADPMAFWTPIQKSIQTIASTTNTPLHYFEKANMPSGNALRTAESPLLKKVKDRAASFGATWREIFRFVLKVEKINSDVQVFWAAVESLDELERWDVSLKKINAGLSHKQALREGGYSEDQIVKIMEEREVEAAAGLYYTRVPQTRVNESHDETQALPNNTGGNE
jgi:hypothetical protein